MSPIYPLIVLFLLTSAASCQLALDRERFDIELHPGEVAEKIVTLTNVGDLPIFEIEMTPVGGSAKDLILIDIPDFDYIDPEDDEEMSIFILIPPETKPDNYTGVIYLFDDTPTPPSIPPRIEFNILVTEQESYGVSLSIDDAKLVLAMADPEEMAEFDLMVRNTGRFRDVVSIDNTHVPEGWKTILIDDGPVTMPYELPLNTGTDHLMTLQVKGRAGEVGEVAMTATSLGNASKNDTVVTLVDVGLAVRGYDVVIDMPEEMVANRTYSGSYTVILMKEEKIAIEVVAPPEVLVVPLTQVVAVSEDRPGTANFTLMTTVPGEYTMAFEMMDSQGVPIPPELFTVTVIEPSDTAILTGEEFVYTTVASLYREDNESVPVLTVPPAGLGDKALDEAKGYSTLIILGGDDVVAPEVEENLKVSGVERIAGSNLWETTWMFASAMWANGTAEVVISGPQEIDIFKAYRLARGLSAPLIVCDSEMTESSRAVIEEMMNRDVKLSKATIVGEVDERATTALKEMGIDTEVA